MGSESVARFVPTGFACSTAEILETALPAGAAEHKNRSGSGIS